MVLEEVKSVLEKYGQTHLLKAYERLDEEGKKKLLSQIETIDFEEMKALYEKTKETVEFGDSKIEPMASVIPENLSEEERKEIINLGEDLIRSGKCAAITMAGGQGTRLGHDGPKGTFDLGLPSHKSLFEILCDNLKEAYEKYNVYMPWYIMTSKANNDRTIEFFEENNYFGYDKSKIKFFKQSELPMIDESGKIVVDESGLIKEGANGSGGTFESLYKSPYLEEMKKNGIEWVFVGGVDNVLVQMADPMFFGFLAKNNYIAGSKTIVKAYPEERVGVFCKKDGVPFVIEYTEIPEDMANLRNEDGSLTYGESHMMLNMFNVKAFDKIAEKKLPYHVAHKKTNYMNENGEVIEVSEPNAYKFEMFIFDAFPIIGEAGLIRGKREENFSPVKNKDGFDSPETARRDYIKYHNL